MTDRSQDPAIQALGDGPAEVVESNFSSGSGMTVQVNTDDLAKKPEPKGEELIGGKFKSQDDLLKAYKELESKLGERPKDAPTDQPEDAGEDDQAEEKPAEDDQSQEEPKDDEEAPKGFDLSTFQAEYAEKGELSDDSYAALEKAGIGRDIVDSYIAGQQALVNANLQSAYQLAGGEQEFKAVVEWGSKNLQKPQQDAFNTALETAVQTGDTTALDMIVSGIRSRMGDGEPNLLSAKSGSTPDGAQPFASRSEMAAAMSDPRYRSDPAYVKSVQDRLRVTEF